MVGKAFAFHKHMAAVTILPITITESAVRRDSGERISRPRALTSPVLGMKTVRLAPSPWDRAAQPQVCGKAARRAEMCLPCRAVPSVVLTKMCLCVRRRLCPSHGLLAGGPSHRCDRLCDHWSCHPACSLTTKSATVSSTGTLTFPVNQQSFQVLVVCWAATKAWRPDAWNLLGTTGNVFAQSTCNNRLSIDTFLRNVSLLESQCYNWWLNATEHRETCR